MNANSDIFFRGNILRQHCQKINRKCFIETIKLKDTYVQLRQITYAAELFEYSHADVINIHTKEQYNIPLECLVPLTNRENALLEMEKRLPEITGLF
jgi:hypothetical protein